MSDLMIQVAAAQAPRHAMMEFVARSVMALGYTPDDCLLQLQRGCDSIDYPSVEVDRLLVCGRPCFEVTVTRSPIVEGKLTITTTPRLIAWPPPAPQDSARPMSGETPT